MSPPDPPDTETARTHPVEETPPDSPPTPDGYNDPYLFKYSTITLLLLSIPIGLVAFGGFGWILWETQGPDVFAAVFDVTILDNVCGMGEGS